ncbi:U6 snRNA-associated Sm-like protein LSm1 [Nematocida sp. AWRm80]|nr:U6 snRNA-associated Sm-like protein LSm1 [Nematocida sp. AWRm80]
MEETQFGTRMLEEYLDHPVKVTTRENTFVYGTLRSFDQYYNILLEDTKQITILEQEYSEIESEAYMLRGENIILLQKGQPPNLSHLTRTSHENIQNKSKSTNNTNDLDYIEL